VSLFRCWRGASGCGSSSEPPAALGQERLAISYIASIWPPADLVFQGGRFLRGRCRPSAAVPHNCCYCVYTVVEGKQGFASILMTRWAAEIASSWTEGRWPRLLVSQPGCQFTSRRRYTRLPKQLLRPSRRRGMADIHWRAYIRADNVDQNYSRADGGPAGMKLLRNAHLRQPGGFGAEDAHG